MLEDASTLERTWFLSKIIDLNYSVRYFSFALFHCKMDGITVVIKFQVRASRCRRLRRRRGEDHLVGEAQLDDAADCLKRRQHLPLQNSLGRSGWH